VKIIWWYLQDSNPQPLKLALYPTELKKYIVVPQHALRVRRGGRGAGRYQYYKLHDCLHHGDELKKDWMEMILTRLEQYICSNKMY
jgi:hypothetical protein